MSNAKTIRLDVAAIAAPTVGSRDVADAVRSKISHSRANVIELDFRDVDFISRSAAHALLVLKEDLERKFLSKKIVVFINTNPSVSEMFRIVAANRAVPLRKKMNFMAKETDIDSLMRDSELIKI